MPQSVIIICSIVATAILFVTYGFRIYGLRARKCQFHPLTIAIWIVNSCLTAVFLLASGNFAMAALTALALAMEIITLILSIFALRRSKHRRWKITASDLVCFGFAIFAIVTWRLSGDANLGAIISFVGSVFGEIPQLRKDYAAPNTDNAIFYILPLARYLTLIGTLTAINFVGLLSSLGWALVLFAELVWLVYCKHRVKSAPRKTSS